MGHAQCNPTLASESEGGAGLSLDARAVRCEYRYCQHCRHEWPARHASCPLCARWLGDRPLQRTEWQIVPTAEPLADLQGYERVGASAVILRVVSDALANDALAFIAAALRDALAAEHVCRVPERGWLSWTVGDLRHAFLEAQEIERRLAAAVQRLEAGPHALGRLRWGIWLDQYVLPFTANQRPRIAPPTDGAIFSFEPDNLLLCSATVYEAVRAWEHFVCIPRRLLSGEEVSGYRLLGHKRPSAHDHAGAAETSPFVGREEELRFLASCLSRSRAEHERAAIIARAGTGKTRLIREWRRRHPDLRVLIANFSLFGGDLVSFAAQLAELPNDRLTDATLRDAVLSRIAAEEVDALVLDDLHWADEESMAFLARLLDAMASRPLLVLLVARPSGWAMIEALAPARIHELAPLPPAITAELAARLSGAGRVAALAAERSGGSPLFVEHFLAWAAETHYDGAGHAPRTLHEVVAARITHLSESRLAAARRGLQRRSAWEAQELARELERIESEIGLWLDRLETGDYGDRIEAARHLSQLERLDLDLFVARTLAGTPRARSSRLGEAIERLLVGSAGEILADLTERAVREDAAERANILREAERAADAVARRYDWPLAAAFYALAVQLAEPARATDLARRLADCRRHLGTASATEDSLDLEASPAVDGVRLPDVWLQLGERFGAARYFRRAAEAAEAINDPALAARARDRASGVAGQ
jgi:hypothetical protein